MSEELAFAIDDAESGIWDLTPITRTFKGNGRLTEWSGLQADNEIPLDHALAVIADKDHDRVTRVIGQAVKYKPGGQYDVVYTSVHPHTKLKRAIRAKGRTKCSAERIAVRFNGIIQDMAEQYRAAQIQRKSETYMRRLAYNVPVVLWETDREGSCIYRNRQWCEATRQPPQQAEGFGWTSQVWTVSVEK